MLVTINFEEQLKFLVFEHRRQIEAENMEYLKCLEEALRNGVPLETFNKFWETEVNNTRINAELKLREASQRGSNETNVRNEGKLPDYLNDRFNQLQQQLLEQRDLLLTMSTAIQSINQKMDTSKIFHTESKEKSNHHNIGDDLTCADVEELIKQTTFKFQPHADTSEDKSDRTLSNSGPILEEENKDLEIRFPTITWQQGEMCSNRIERVTHGIVEDEVQQHRIVDDGIRQHRIVDDGIQKHWIVEDSIQQHRIVDDGINQHRIVDDGINQHRIVDDGIQKHRIVDDGINQHRIVDDGIQQHRTVDDGVQEHWDLNSGMQQTYQTIIIYKQPTNQDTTGEKTIFQCRRKIFSTNKTPDGQDQNNGDHDTNQSYQLTAKKISAEHKDQEEIASSTRATGMYAEAIAQQILARGNAPPKYVPRSGAFFEFADVTQCVTENTKHYTDYYLTEPAFCRVRLMFRFDESARLVVTLLVSGSPHEDSLWPVYLSGEGKIFNSKSKRYTYLWRMEAQRFDDPGDIIEVQFEVKTCLETLKGSLHDVTYEQLLERNYEKSNKMNINWKLEAKNWTEACKS
ncbi:unnamed protein product [Lymnaea stagnalis]|uniref:MATH domain-containing protein n=1 Tax=Lymnaea stagnalis TaxID=6523 RepID=A0AAV2HJU1_LYMST